MALTCSTFKLHPHAVVWWEVDGIEPLARRDRVYSAATAPACPYLHFPIVLFGCRDRSRTDFEQLMRLPGSRTSLQMSARLFHLHRVQPVRPRSAEFPALYPNWRKREVLIPNGKAIHLASNERRTPVRLRFHIWWKVERTMLIRPWRTIRSPSDADTLIG